MSHLIRIAAPSSSTILVIEDNDDLREAMRLALENAGWSVEGARDGVEAFAYLSRARPPCAIVLDLGLPGIDGAKFRQILLQESGWATIPVIVCTADDEAITRRSVPDIQRWIRKPCSAEAIVDAADPYRTVS